MNKYFFKNINEIINIEDNKCGLYLMDVKYSNKDYIDKNIVKFGYTHSELLKRLRSYKDCSLENIYFYKLESPRPLIIESLVKGFLKYTSLFPIIGQEYYNNCKEYIQLIIEEILKKPFNNIIINYNYYISKKLDYKNMFSEINENILKIDSNYKYYINEITKDNKDNKDNLVNEKSMFCEFCEKQFLSISSLNYHKKTAKFCLEIQKVYKDNCKFVCEFCNRKFTKKDKREDHLKICKIKKDTIINNLNIELNNLKNNEKELNNFKIEINILKNELKIKNEYIDSLENKYNQLLSLLKNK